MDSAVKIARRGEFETAFGCLPVAKEKGPAIRGALLVTGWLSD